jgi:phosphohistidine phosphatase
MKTLYLMRHAKSDWTQLVPDLERPLNARGRKAAPGMGNYLSSQHEVPQLIMCSPSLRTRTTASLVADCFVQTTKIEVFTDIYEASPEQLWELVSAIPDYLERVMLIGHNPAMEEILMGVSPETLSNFPTAAVAKLTSSVASWKYFGESAASVVWFVKPKELSI